MRNSFWKRAREPGSRGSRTWLLTSVCLLLTALLAGLVYSASSALAVSTLHILDNETGGDCLSIGVWDAQSRTCTMNTELDVEGFDAIHIEGDGITLDGAGHRISGNATTGNGVSIDGYRDVTVKNLESARFSIGIYVRNSRGIILTGNNIHDDSFGVYVSGADSSGNILLRNSFTTNGYGIVLVNGPQETAVTSNTFSGNSYGIQLGGSGTSGSIVMGNVISGSTAYGLTIEGGASSNSIYNNIFDSNTTHAGVFGGTGNTFNQPAPTGGNWWSGWTAPDALPGPPDGFVDSPYVFTGAQDNLPFAEQYEWDDAPPVVSNLTPSGVLHTGNTSFTATYADAEPSSGVNVASVALAINPAPYETFTCVATGSPAGTISCTWIHPDYARFDEGHYEYDITITDNQGNTGTGHGSFDVMAYQIADAPGGGDCALIGTWDAGTKTCTMTADLTVERINAISIASDGVTLDGDGHSIYGNGNSAYGVQIVDRTGATVKNLQEDGFWTGIHMDGSTACTVSGVTTHESELIDSDGNVVTACSFIGSSWDEVLTLDHADNNHILGNNFTLDQSYYAVDIMGSSGNEIRGNQITGSSVYGVRAYFASNTEVKGNTISGCDYAISMRASGNNLITGNAISGSTSTGLEFTSWTTYGSTNNQVYNNIFDGNTTHATVDATSTGNVFNLAAPIGGNWWSGWTGPDVLPGPPDGFVDGPYVFTGGQDNLPYATQAGMDGVAPAISNVQPTGTIRNGNPAITADYSDPAISSGINTDSAAVAFTSYPNQAPDDFVCTAVGSPAGFINCTQRGSPIYPLDQGHYEFQVSVTDTEGNTGTTSGSFDIQAYRITDAAGGQDCTLFGTWDENTRTCTMTADLDVYDLDGLYIQSDAITLDGNGHSLTCTDTLGSICWGTIITGNTGVTIKDLTVTGFYTGIFLPGASGNTISGNHLTGNLIGAMIPYANAPGGGTIRPTGNTIMGNDMSGNSYAGLYFMNADYNRVVDNTFTGNTTMCVIADAGEGVENHGLIFSGNTCSGSPNGFHLWRTHESRFVGNSVAPVTSGKGFALNKCDGNVFERNVINGDSASGFYGFADEGMSPDNDDNEFFSNSFIKTTFPYQFSPYNLTDAADSGNTFTREFGGGNYYSWRDTPAEGCNDVNSDGFCDASYVFSSGQDERPWTTAGAWEPDYYWTWYDNLYGADWVLMANPASAAGDSWFDLEIAGDDMDPGTLEGMGSGQVPAGSSLTPAYPGMIGGPVSVNHRGTGQAITSQRILWAGNSLEEVLGMDAGRITDHYYWTWYDEQSPGYKNWVMVANPDPVYDVYAEVRIAGTVRWSGAIPGGGNVTPHFPGVMGGPVEVQAWTGSDKTAPADVLASQRVLMNGDSAFNELPGTPAGELSDNYVWTWYDNLSPGAQNWVMLANPRAYEVFFEVRIEEAQVATGSIGPGLTQPVSMAPAAMGGPVEVRFWKDGIGGSMPATAIASQRVLWGPSFGELPGYPYSALDSTYHWTWYDQKSTGAANWVMVALDPAETGQVHVIVEYTAFNDDGSTELRTGEADLDPAVAGQTRWYWTDPGYRGGPVEVTAYLRDHPETPRDVIASQRVLWNGFFNEVVGSAIN